MIRKIILILIFFLMFISNAYAACTEAPAGIWTPDTCGKADIQACLDDAGFDAENTINVPAGNCTWDTGFTITEGVYLIGAGAGNTNITGNLASSTDYIIRYAPTTLSDNDHFRISGFTFDLNSRGIALSDGSNAAGTEMDYMRIDHNAFTSSNIWVVLRSGEFYGVADNNTITSTNQSVLQSLGNERHSWDNFDQTYTLGSAKNFYFEDNTISVGGNDTVIYGGQGGRYCLRFNDITVSEGIYPLWDSHGNQGAGSGIYSTLLTEIYKNDVTMTTGNCRAYQGRGGQVLLWGNDITTSGTAYAYIWEEVWDAYNAKDNATPPMHIHDTYYWNNTKNATTEWGYYLNKNICGTNVGQSTPTCTVVDHGYTLNENDEFYFYNASFDGTAGIGSGVRASRPATCTTGVAYWSTDQGGNWNNSNAGANDGCLDKCTATNTWTDAWYTPYTYPHPLTGGSAVPSGTVVVVGGIVESDVKDGGKTLVGTMTDDTLDADIGTDCAETTALIAGIDSNKAEAGGWDAVVKAGLTFANVVRTSDTVFTITLPAFGAYEITESETITVTIPAVAVASGVETVATPTFIVSVDTTPNVTGLAGSYDANGQTVTYDANGLTVTGP